jgi:hypothetical protein
MTEREIADLMNTPFETLAMLCQKPETLAQVLTLAINIGVQMGEARAHKAMNKMLRHQDEVTIGN